jgi:hypothetical protein
MPIVLWIEWDVHETRRRKPSFRELREGNRKSTMAREKRLHSEFKKE